MPSATQNLRRNYAAPREPRKTTQAYTRPFAPFVAPGRAYRAPLSLPVCHDTATAHGVPRRHRMAPVDRRTPSWSEGSKASPSLSPSPSCELECVPEHRPSPALSRSVVEPLPQHSGSRVAAQAPRLGAQENCTAKRVLDTAAAPRSCRRSFSVGHTFASRLPSVTAVAATSLRWLAGAARAEGRRMRTHE